LTELTQSVIQTVYFSVSKIQ